MRVLIAVIAYNEEKNIVKVIKELQENNSGYDIVVIDNCSNDATVELCRGMGIKVISHCVNSGSPFGTVMTYFLYAYHNHYDVLCQFDGDGQHVASELEKIISPVIENQADYVIGSRFLEKEGFQSYFMRRMGIRMFAFLDSLIIGQKLTDVTSGFRAYGKETIAFFANYYKHEIYDTSQLLLLSSAMGARIMEVPVVMRAREYGVSDFNFLNSVSFTLKGLINIVGCLLQRSRIKRFIHNKYRE